MPIVKVNTNQTTPYAIGHEMWRSVNGAQEVALFVAGFDTLRDLARCISAHIAFMGFEFIDSASERKLDTFEYLRRYIAEAYTKETGKEYSR